jgi:hypothetical protein
MFKRLMFSARCCNISRLRAKQEATEIYVSEADRLFTDGEAYERLMGRKNSRVPIGLRQPSDCRELLDQEIYSLVQILIEMDMLFLLSIFRVLTSMSSAIS